MGRAPAPRRRAAAPPSASPSTREGDDDDDAETRTTTRTSKTKTVFVTVGTTSFDALVAALDTARVGEILTRKGFKRVVMQTGKGSHGAPRTLAKTRGLRVRAFAFAPSIDDEIRGADLVVSHAGAGSVFETLRAKKPLLVVVNDALMGNHQQELAETLHEMGHLRWCAPEGVGDAIAAFDETSSKPYQPGDPAEVQRAIRSMLLRR
ncbi:glycosyltransferase [Micromonas pusilla CCMP1545]|mgnify:CR=1 FL=1|jgi:beta-1,4-N-acetylglucosaminyltransferase|uniref:Glycosyltransferase n=1 Tax=Micromonas pusilla (strain CCMP1545) TaxID=564608 RepID=C1MTZ0_MICPC|nr:glycosyltransferase [Micromonas pusilla CCMP1545]EEH56537.1 glycosyltransferase [Micromonas pusilla CCMP1545]|eukprot:XP_003059405.1 glycosyltransferase [Micromonas pusilla CCMP1545]